MNQRLRGGSWDDDPLDLQSASRLGYDPTSRGGDIGFRCAATEPDGGGK
jgi:formylglycine-generating enzyme required for sulfatase activity